MKHAVVLVLLGLVWAACGARLSAPDGRENAASSALAQVSRDDSAPDTTLPDQPAQQTGHIKVAAVQMHSVHSLEENVRKIAAHLEQCAQQGVRVAVFPECATTGYFPKEIRSYTEAQYLEAERNIAETCKKNGIYCIVGTPYFQHGFLHNMALVINDRGETIYRQAKIQLVTLDRWARAGDTLSVFRIDDVICSLIICHDSTFPELVRLPVMKGARLVFYLSWESDMTLEYKLDPYRAQVVARARENKVYMVHANAPQRLEPREGSHGQSRIVDPDGVLLREASIFQEEVLIEELDMSKAKDSYARQTLRPLFLRDWWENGITRIGEAGP